MHHKSQFHSSPCPFISSGSLRVHQNLSRVALHEHKLRRFLKRRPTIENHCRNIRVSVYKVQARCVGRSLGLIVAMSYGTDVRQETGHEFHRFAARHVGKILW